HPAAARSGLPGTVPAPLRPVRGPLLPGAQRDGRPVGGLGALPPVARPARRGPPLPGAPARRRPQGAAAGPDLAGPGVRAVARAVAPRRHGAPVLPPRRRGDRPAGPPQGDAPAPAAVAGG